MKFLVLLFAVGVALLCTGLLLLLVPGARWASVVVAVASVLCIGAAQARFAQKVLRNQKVLMRTVAANKGSSLPTTHFRSSRPAVRPGSVVDTRAPKGCRPSLIEVEDLCTRRPAYDVTVAMIVDEFSFNSLRPDCQAVVLEPDTWRETMDATQPDLFFCESAWSGADSQRRPWKGKIYGSENFARENRTELFAILDYCREHDIPTVFWNKEDPSHFRDTVHNFVDTASRFDHIFTTAAECVEGYKERLGHPSVHVLPFAVQPRLFNPKITGPRTSDVVFAGAWYANHEQRSEDMAAMFDAVLASGRQLKIYDRFFGGDDPLHDFPERYRPMCRPPVPHNQIAEIYKESEIGMTINTETASATMFARRIFELMACNTYVVSNYSQGVYECFGSGVTYLDKDPRALERLSADDMAKARARNLEAVLSEHTYADRLAKVFDVAGVAYAPAHRRMVAALRIDDAGEAEAAMQHLRDLHGPFAAKLLIFGANIPPLTVSELFMEYQSSDVQCVSEQLILDGHVNVVHLVGAAEGLFVLGEDDPELALGRMELHVQYADTMMAVGLPEQQFTMQCVPATRTLFVPTGEIKRYARAVSDRDDITAYVV